MSNRLEAYLDDLDARLRPHLDDERRTEVLAELRFHLHMSARDAEAEFDMAPDDAARAALRALGPVQEVAEDLVRQHRGGTTQSPWRVARPAMITYAITCGVVPLVGWLFPFSGAWDQAILIAPTACLAAFVVAVWRSQRWLWTPMVVGMVATFLVVAGIVATKLYQRLAVRDIFGSSPTGRVEMIRRLDHQLRVIALGADGYARRDPALSLNGKWAVPTQTTSAIGITAPFLPFTLTYISRKPVPALMYEPYRDDGVRRWREFGTDLKAKVQSLRETHVAGYSSSWATYYVTYEAIYVAFQAFALVPVNLVVLALSKGRRRRRALRDPHLA